MQAITSCLPNQVGIFYGCQGLGCLNQTHPAKRRQAPNPHKRVSFKRTSPLTNVFVKPNEQCQACSSIVIARKRTFRGTRKERSQQVKWTMSRACPNIVMATKRTLGGTRKERLAWHLYQLVIIQGVVCPPKFQVLCAWCLQNFSWLYGLKQRYGAVSNRNRLSLQTLQFVSLSPSPVVIMSVETPSSLKKDKSMSVPSFGMKRWQIKEKTLFL